jgi:hypothetical protein
MLDLIRYRIGIARLRTQLRQYNAETNKQIASLDGGSKYLNDRYGPEVTLEEIYRIGSEFHAKHYQFFDSRNDGARRIEEKIEQLKIYRLERIAKRLDLPIPHRGEDVSDSAQRAELRDVIRGERRARREQLLWWVPLVFGLLGALTGLIAVFRSTH